MLQALNSARDVQRHLVADRRGEGAASEGGGAAEDERRGDAAAAAAAEDGAEGLTSDGGDGGHLDRSVWCGWQVILVLEGVR